MFPHFHSVVIFLYNIKNFLCPDDEDLDRDYNNLHYEKIITAGQSIWNTTLPLAERAQAAHDLGILGYTGGYAATKCTAEYMPNMVSLLKTPNLSDQHIIKIIQGLIGICCVHYNNQREAQSLGLYDILVKFIAPDRHLSRKTKFWSCYLLSVLCCNIPAIRDLMSSDSVRVSLEELEAQDWYGWPKNYAQELLCLLGFWLPKPIQECPTDQEN